MVEYIYNAVMATAGEDIAINAILKESPDTPITSGCYLNLYGDKLLIRVEGEYQPDVMFWSFIIPAEATKGLNGRYWYSIQSKNTSLDFKQPIYLK